jgi:hypothetical protein
LPDSEAATGAADLNDLSGKLGAGAERHGRLNLILAGNHQNIRKVDAAGVYPDTYLFRAKRW